MTKKPRCPNGSRRKPPKTGVCVKTKKKSVSKSKSKTLTLPSSSKSKSSKSKSSKSKSSKSISSKSISSKSKSSKTMKKGNYRSFLKCEMRRLKKENPSVRQQSIMKMAAKNWNKGK